MTGKLKRRFVVTVMLSEFIVLLFMIFMTRQVSGFVFRNEVDSLLDYLATNDGYFPHRTREEGASSLDGFFRGEIRVDTDTAIKTRYFFVRSDADGSVTEINTDNLAGLTVAGAESVWKQAYSLGKTKGFWGSYRYLKAAGSGDSTLMIFVDYTQNRQAEHDLLLAGASVGVLCIVISLPIAVILSKRAVKPTVEAIEKQKQFISDAGHEIKTPLAIISANAEVIEAENGPSEWTESIKHQVSRLTALTSNLLTLSKLGEDALRVEKTEFDLSETAREAVASFDAVAMTAGKTLTAEITPGVRYNGDPGSIRELISVLTDNAIKYCADGGEIRVRLFKKGKNTVFETVNPVDAGVKVDTVRIFDRFYREDSSRARATGGYGIGLSVASATVEAHRGTIKAEQKGDTVTFTVIL